MYHTSFHNVTSNNASPGLRENVILINTYLFGTKIWLENLTPLGKGSRGKGTPRGPYLPVRCVCPHDVWGRGPCGTRERMWEVSLYVENWCVLQYLISNVWQLVLAKVSVKRRVIDSDEHDLLYGPGDALGIPVMMEKLSSMMGLSMVLLWLWMGERAP